MPSEFKYPDGTVFSLTGLSGAYTDVDEDPDSPDASWLTAPGSNTNTAVRASFPTPTGNPTVGAGLQTFRAWVRKTNHSTNPTAVIELWETGGGAALATVVASTTITSTSGQMLSGTWNANLLGTADGSAVEIRVVGTVGGGGPSSRASVEVGALEWTVDYSLPTLAAVTGVYTLTGVDAILAKSYILAVDTGSYSVTGFAARLIKHSTVAEETAYHDGSVTITDNDGVWTNDANAFDGSTATVATTTTGSGAVTVNELYGRGHTSTVLYNQIVNIFGRIYANTPTGGITATWTDETQFNYSAVSSTNDGWTTETPIAEMQYNGWTEAKWSNFSVAFWGNVATVNLEAAKSEFRVQYLPNATCVVYPFNETGFVDAQSVWTNETNINNSYTVYTELAISSNGSNSNNALVLHGTSAPASGGTITDVYIFTGMFASNYNMHAEVWTDGKTELLDEYTVPLGNAGYIRVPYRLVPPPSGGWTWSAVQNLELYIYGTDYSGGGLTGRLYIAQLKVFTAAAQANELDTEIGSYALSGQDATFKRALQLEATVGSYNINGQSVALSISGGEWTADANHFTVDSATHLADGYHTDGVPSSTLYADVGSYSLTGYDISFKIPRLSTVTGTYAVTGQTVTFKRALRLQAATGAYTYTGIASELDASRKLYTDTGIYFVSGEDIVLQTAGTLGAVTGNYNVTGSDPSFIRSIKLNTVTGEYNTSGLSVSLKAQYKLNTEIGNYLYTGINPDIRTAGTLSLETGNYNVIGNDPSFIRSIKLNTVTGEYNTSGLDVSLKAQYVFNTDSGIYSLSGINADLRTVGKISVESGIYSISGIDAQLIKQGILHVDTGIYNITGIDAELSNAFKLETIEGTFIVTGESASLNKASLLKTEVGAYLLSGESVDFNYSGASVRRIMIVS